MNKALTWALVIALGVGGYFLLSRKPEISPDTAPVITPALSADATVGAAVFQGTCAACHGANLRGTQTGPPLLHKFYRPALHSDYAITRAVQNGVARHHWRFGDMPPQEGISDAQITGLIAYIREMQAVNDF